jgi:hypothetical protein
MDIEDSELILGPNNTDVASDMLVASPLDVVGRPPACRGREPLTVYDTASEHPLKFEERR